MKHTLNILTLTALAAAASAQTAPAAAGLNYNQIGFSRTSTENTLSVQAALGQSNLLIGASTSNDRKSNATAHVQLSAGYVFKSVVAGIDATVGVIQSTADNTSSSNISNTVYTLGLRRGLGEILPGLEIAAGYAGTLSSEQKSTFTYGGTNGTAETATFGELAYNINKGFAVAVGVTKFKTAPHTQTVFSVRASF